MIQPQGICLQKDAYIVLGGKPTKGQVWQRTDREKVIYAVIGQSYFALNPDWTIVTDPNGNPIQQGMSLENAVKGDKENTDTYTIHPGVIVGVRMIAAQLTNDELVAIFMVATFGNNPKETMGYEKAKSLFTKFDGTKMHADTLAVLDAIVGERIK